MFVHYFPLFYSAADKIKFSIEYSLHCLSIYSRHSPTPAYDLQSTLKELLEDEKLKQLFSIQQQQTARLPSLSTELQDGCGRIICGEGGTDGDQLDLEAREEFVPKQEQYLQSSEMAHGLSPIPLAHSSYPMMMQSALPLPPFMMPAPAHMPLYYPMMHPHLPIPSVMGFFMPPMQPQAVPPPSGMSMNIATEETEQLQDSLLSPRQSPIKDKEADNSNTLQGDVNIISINQFEKKLEMVSSNALPVSTVTTAQPSLQNQSTDQVTSEKSPVSSPLPLGSTAVECVVTHPHHHPPVDTTAAPANKGISVEEVVGVAGKSSREAVKDTVIKQKSISIPSSLISVVRDVDTQVKKSPSNSKINPTVNSTLFLSAASRQSAINYPTTTQQSSPTSVHTPQRQHVSARKPAQFKSSRTESNQPGLPCRPSSNQPSRWKESPHDTGKLRGGGEQANDNQQHKRVGGRNKAGGKKRNRNHSGDISSCSADMVVSDLPNALTGNVSQQEPLRQFPMSNHGMKFENVHRSRAGLSEGTKSFRALPSPTCSGVIVSSEGHGGAERETFIAPAVSDTGQCEVESEDKKSEWPTFTQPLCATPADDDAMLCATGDSRGPRRAKGSSRTGLKEVSVLIACVYMQLHVLCYCVCVCMFQLRICNRKSFYLIFKIFSLFKIACFSLLTKLCFVLIDLDCSLLQIWQGDILLTNNRILVA